MNIIKYRVDFSRRLTEFKLIDLQIDKTLLEKGVEKFNLKSYDNLQHYKWYFKINNKILFIEIT